MCRGLYTCRTGERISKRKAAAWAAREWPRWADLIEAALAWRASQCTPGNAHGAATLPETCRFLADIEQHCLDASLL